MFMLKIGQEFLSALGKTLDYSASGNGYTELPNGMILQWGRATHTKVVNFPIPFPNTCLIVVSSGKWSNVNPSYVTLSGVESWTKTGFQLGSFGFFKVGEWGEAMSTQSFRSSSAAPNFAGTTFWFAIGY